MQSLAQIFKEQVSSTGVNVASGGMLGFISNGGLFASAAGDFMAAVSNEFAAMKDISPGGFEMENELLNWMKNLFGYPKDSVGYLTTGASLGTLTAMITARETHKIVPEVISSHRCARSRTLAGRVK